MFQQFNCPDGLFPEVAIVATMNRSPEIKRTPSRMSLLGISRDDALEEGELFTP